jgi:inosine-uridine nucleoside N-ribohydrolase
VCITVEDLKTIAARGTEVARHFHDNSLAWCNWWTETFPEDAGFHPWDSAAIAFLKHPEYFVVEERGWRISEVPKRKSWLECDTTYSGRRIAFCTGFAGSTGKGAFVKDVVENVY